MRHNVDIYDPNEREFGVRVCIIAFRCHSTAAAHPKEGERPRNCIVVNSIITCNKLLVTISAIRRSNPLQLSHCRRY